MAQTIDVQGVLEDVRARLDAATQAAREVETQTQELLAFLRHETQEWVNAIESDKSHAAALSAELADRWIKLQARLKEVEADAEAGFEGCQGALVSQWDHVRGTWSSTVNELQEIQVALAEHSHACESSRALHQDVEQRLASALTTAEQFVEANVVAKAAEFQSRLDEQRLATEAAIVQATLTGRERIADASAATVKHMEEASSRIEELEATFLEELTTEVGDFEDRIKKTCEELKTAGQVTEDRLATIGTTISTLTESLMQGADDVVDVLGSTQVGLSTVVGIVQTGIDICEEVTDAFHE